MLTLLPALVIDSENVQNWKAKGEALNVDDYAKVESGYLTAMRRVAAAENAFGEPTPQSTKSLLYYHQWRMLYNWQHIIDTLAGGMTEQDKTALAVRRHFGGRSLLTVAEQAKNTIPAGDPMRALIEAESKQ